MFKLISLIIESQSQPFPPLWRFSFFKPTKYQAKFKENWFFSPYRLDFFIDKSNMKHKYRNLFVFYTFYPLRSIFFDLSVFFKRRRAFLNCFPIYFDWVVERPWFRFIFKKFLPAYGVTVGVILFPVVAAYAVAFFRLFKWYFFKKKIWAVFLSFIWKSFFETIIFFFFSHLCIFCFLFFWFFLSCLVFLIFISSIFAFFVFFKKIYFFFFFNKAVFERGSMVSKEINFKMGTLGSSHLFFSPVYLTWRLSGFLSTRYAKVLERFFSYQPPFRLQNEPVFVDFLAIRGKGWLKFNSFYSRVLINQNYLPNAVGFYKKTKIIRWRLLPFSFSWFSNLTRRSKKFRSFRFYTKNYILYQPFGERFLLKPFPFLYNSLALFYTKAFKCSLKSFLEPMALKSKPWWFYRERFLYFFYVRWFFFYFFSLYSPERPFRGTLIKLYRPAGRQFFLYDIFDWFFVSKTKTTRLFNTHWMSNLLFSRIALLYTNFWVWIFCCLEAFSWLIFFPIRWSLKVKKNNLVRLVLLIFLIFVCCLLLD